MPTYTQEELDKALQDQLERVEARHFEEKTEEVLGFINQRLKEANGYKATIGKDVREVKDEVRDIKIRLADLEDARKKEAEKVKEDLEERQRLESQRREWFQDKWIRVGIAGGLVWEAWTMFGEPLKTAVYHMFG